MNIFKELSEKTFDMLNVSKSLNTITTKLLMLFLFMTIIPLIVLAQFSTDLINSNMTSRAKWQLELNNRIAQNQYNEKLKNLKNLLVQGISTPIEEAYSDFVTTGNHQKLSNKLKNISRKGNLSFLFIVDKNKNLIASGNSMRINGQLTSFSNLVNRTLLSGEPIASTEVFAAKEILEEGNDLEKNAEISGEESKKKYVTGLSQVVSLPISNANEDIEAIAIAGNLLAKDNTIGDAIRDLTGATLMIAQILDNNEAIVISTNLTTTRGDRALGRIIPHNIVNDVLAFQTYQGREYQVREYQLAVYYPIFNSVGSIIGLIYAGIPENQFTMLAEQNIKLVSWISILGLFCAILLSSIFSRSITSPILKLADAAKKISMGDLSVRVNVKGSSEINQMGETFNNMAESLQREEQLRDDFVATLTHDLKVPLLAENTIINYMINDKYGEVNPEQKEVLEEIKTTNSGTLEMVNTLLEVYRYDAGKNILLKSELDLRNLINLSVKNLLPLSEDKKLNVSVSIPETELMVKIDEREIKRVMHNLISNAIACSLKRGSIRVTVANYKDQKVYTPNDKDFQHTTLKKDINVENHVIVSVYDTGIGMDEEEICNLFKRFSGNKGRKPSSIGLGLYYSQQVIAAHKGYIWAESQEGEGSAFKFTIPLVV